MSSTADLFNTFSNLFIIPAVLIALNLRLWATAALSTAVGSVSFLYHACQTELFCIFTRDVQGEKMYFFLQTLDQTLVFAALIWFSYYLLEISFRLTVALVLLTIPIFYLTTASGSEWRDVINLVIIGWIILCGFFYVVVTRKRLQFGKRSLFLAFVLAVLGLVFYVLDDRDGQDDDRYNSFHGAWHMTIFLALFFVITTKIEPTRFYVVF